MLGHMNDLNDYTMSAASVKFRYFIFFSLIIARRALTWPFKNDKL